MGQAHRPINVAYQAEEIQVAEDQLETFDDPIFKSISLIATILLNLNEPKATEATQLLAAKKTKIYKDGSFYEIDLNTPEEDVSGNKGSSVFKTAKVAKKRLFLLFFPNLIDQAASRINQLGTSAYQWFTSEYEEIPDFPQGECH